MRHDEMLISNCTDILRQIINGCHTISQISKGADLSSTTVEKICDILLEKRIIKSRILRTSSVGRPKMEYFVSDLHYCVYVEESENYFKCIFINTNQYAIDRFDKRKFISAVPLQEVVKRVVRAITMRDDYKRYCRGVFVYCNDESAQFLPNDFKRVTREEFISSSLKTENEILLFEFPSRCIISINGRIFNTSATREQIEHVLTPDRILTYEQPFYNEIFLSLQQAALKDLFNLF